MACRFLCIGVLVFPAFFPLAAALVITERGQERGKIVRLEEERVVLRLDSGTELSLNKDNILTIYDDDGNLLWSHPSIVLQDNSPDLPGEKMPLPAFKRPRYQIEALGTFGLMSSTSWFSTYPLGVKHDYRSLYGFELGGAYNLDGDSYLTVSLGYTQRNMTANGITMDSVYGVAVWPIQYLDFRVGYRIRQDWLFAEVGLLQTFQIGSAPLSIDTGNGSVQFQSERANTGGYLGAYLGLGAIIPIFRDLSGMVLMRYDHGLTSAVGASLATESAPDGSVVSSAPLHLVPWSVSLSLGVQYSL